MLKIEPLLTLKEVAEILQVPPREVYEIVELKRYALQIGGRRLRWRRADVERYLDEAATRP